MGQFEQAFAIREAANRYLVSSGYNPISDPNQSPLFREEQRRRKLRPKRNNRRSPPPQRSDSMNNPHNKEILDQSNKIQEQQQQSQQPILSLDDLTPSLPTSSFTQSRIEPGQQSRNEGEEVADKMISDFLASLPSNPSPLPLIEQQTLAIIDLNNKSNTIINENIAESNKSIPLSPLENPLPNEFSNFPDSQDDLPEFPPRKLTSVSDAELEDSPDSSLHDLKIVEYSSEDSSKSEEVAEILEKKIQHNGHTVHTYEPKVGINSQVINEIECRKAKMMPDKRITRSASKN